jgi:hypothetical protein
MTRPKRLYVNSKGKYYYIIDGKKKYIKVPPTMSQKQVQNINIKNIIGSTTARRLKRRKKKIEARYQQRIVPNMVETTQSGLPSYIFRPGKSFTSLGDLTTKADDNTEKKLIDIFLKGATQVYNSIASSIGNPPIEGTPPREGTPSSLRRNIFPENPVEEERNPTPLSNMGQRGFTPEGIPITPPSPVSDTTRLKKPKGEKPKGEKPKGKKSNVPTQSDFSKIGTFGLAKRFNESKEETNLTPLKRSKSNKRKIVGSGEDFGLYNDQIEQIMKKRINNFVPVVAKDQVDSLLGYVKKGDKFFSAVVNTDPSSSGGRHWRCIVMDNRDDFPSAEYFDPLCETMKPEESLLNVMREIAKKMNPEKYFKYKFSEIRRQSFNKSNCGYHVCKYIEDRWNGIPFSEASGYDDYEKRMKGKGAPDNSADGEKELKNYEKMIKKKFSEFL